MNIKLCAMNSAHYFILSILVVYMVVGYVSAQTCLEPPLGILGWWPGDHTASDIQAGHDGILEGGATFVAGFVDGAFALDGINSFVRVPHTMQLDITGALTIDAWIQTSDVGADQIIVSKAQSGGTLSGINYYFGIFTSRLTFAVTGNEVQQGDTPLLSNTWYHVAVTYDGAQVRFYLNGVLDGVRALSAIPLANVADLEIGRFGLGGTLYFSGLIDEVDLFDRALSEAEIQAIVNASRAGKCKGETCEMRTDYDTGGCSGIFQVFSVDDLNTYVSSNFGRNDGDRFQHLKIAGDLTGTTLDIETPCRMTLAVEVVLRGDFVSLDARKGVIDQNGYAINARTACVLSSQDSAELGDNTVVAADNLTVQGAKRVKIGRNATVSIADTLTLTSTGDFESSEAIVETGAMVTAGAIALSASRGAHLGNDTITNAVSITLMSTGETSSSDAGLQPGARVTASDLLIAASGLARIGQRSNVNLTGSLVVESTGSAGGSIAIVRAGADVLVGESMDLVSGNKATIAKDATISVIDNLHMEAEALNKCTVTSSAIVTFGSKSGSCTPLLP